MAADGSKVATVDALGGVPCTSVSCSVTTGNMIYDDSSRVPGDTCRYKVGVR